MNTFQSTFSSARNQRIIFYLALLVLVGGVVALIVKFAGGSSHTSLKPAPGFKPVLPAKPSKDLVDANGAKVKSYGQLSPDIKNTISSFVLVGAINENYGGSWKYLLPNSTITRGYTYKKWATSNSHPLIPLPGYTMQGITYRLEEATKKEILVSMTIQPTKPSVGRPQAFRIGLVSFGKGANERWLVDYWMPASNQAAVPVAGPSGAG
jgi:hypothetical protein